MTEDLTAVAEAPSRTGTRPFRKGPLLGGVLAIILAASATVAFTMPAVALQADRPIGTMLPATTLFYLSADLNPTGTKRDNLDRIEHAYTSQPTWKHIASLFHSTTSSTRQTNGCYNQTHDEAMSHLTDLGHTSVFALIDSKGLNFQSATHAGSTIPNALERAAVFLAPLDTHLTLVQAIAGKTLALQRRVATYNGVDIFAEQFKACGELTSAVPHTMYAALYHNYVVLGLRTEPIERIIDTGAGKSPALSTTTEYGLLQKQLPSDELGSVYLSRHALLGTGWLQHLNPMSGTSASNVQRQVQSTAIALYAEPYGFRLRSATIAHPNSRHAARLPSALASSLPSDTLGLVALGNATQRVKPYLGQLGNGADMTTLRAVIDDMSGEMDLVLLSGSGSTPVTGALAWQIAGGPESEAHLAAAVKHVKTTMGTFNSERVGGQTVHVDGKGNGYAVVNGWAIVSPDIKGTITRHILGGIGGSTLQSLPAYAESAPIGYSPNVTAYLNVTTLRQSLEARTLSGSTSLGSTYQNMVQPFVAPIRILAANGGTSTNGRVVLGEMVVRIGSNP